METVYNGRQIGILLESETLMALEPLWDDLAALLPPGVTIRAWRKEDFPAIWRLTCRGLARACRAAGGSYQVEGFRPFQGYRKSFV